MIQIDVSTLVKRLNPLSRQALEMAATVCMSLQATEITVSHVLIQMLAFLAAICGSLPKKRRLARKNWVRR
jgi:hypothetical protein